MNKLRKYFGLYYYWGLVFDVIRMNSQLVASMLGVPEGFEIILEPSGEDRFRMRGGPVDRSTVIFTRDATGAVSGMRAGAFELAKITLDELRALPVPERLLAPEFDLTPARRAAFDELLGSCLEWCDGGWVHYELPYPKHEFVQYVTARNLVIFHGSNNTEIMTFEPVRKSIELQDKSGRGNLQAVYGTHDGLWAMFFAVVDRARIKGSIRNGVTYLYNRSGEQLSVYNFSINQEQLAEKPYVDGALYLLPRDTFVQLKLTEESYANEWASERPVQPYAKLLIQPADFPFLEKIGGHDDSELLRLGTISENIHTAATSASLEGDRFEVTLPVDADVVEQLDEYVSKLKIQMPAVKLDVEDTAISIKLVFTSLPPAMQQVFADDYRELLSN
jgi:hypothetical protein